MNTIAPTRLDRSNIGALFDPVANRSAMPEVLRRARAEEPVFYSAKFDAWIITSYKDVKFVLNHAREFSSVGALDAAAIRSAEASKRS